MERARLTTDDLHKKFPKIDEWLLGDVLPTLRQLEKFSKATLTPLGFFFLPTPPDDKLPIPLFRTKEEQDLPWPSPELIETVRTMQKRQDWLAEHLAEEGESKLDFVGEFEIDTDPVTVANRIRTTLGIDPEWASRHRTWEDALEVLIEATEVTGIVVTRNGVVGNNTHRPLDAGEFRGFVLINSYAPMIFVNGVDFKSAQMFTLAHELAHVFFGSSAAFDLRQLMPASDPTEVACNRVAAEVLVPASAMTDRWPAHYDYGTFRQIARTFKVSPLVAARRALDLELITKNEFFQFYDAERKEFLKRKKKKKPGGDFLNTQNFRVGKRFAKVVSRATAEGKLLYSEAYRLTGLYGRSFDRFMSSLRDRK